MANLASTTLADQFVVVAKVCARGQLAELLYFASRGEDEMLHANRALFFGSHEGRSQCYVADIAAAEIKLAREKNEINIGGHRSFRWKQPAPDSLSIIRVGEWKLDRVVHAARE